MTERMWFFARNNQQEGPIPESQLQALLVNQTLPMETLVWADHLSNWTPASQVDAFLTRPTVPAANPQPQAPWGQQQNPDGSAGEPAQVGWAAEPAQNSASQTAPGYGNDAQPAHLGWGAEQPAAGAAQPGWGSEHANPQHVPGGGNQYGQPTPAEPAGQASHSWGNEHTPAQQAQQTGGGWADVNVQAPAGYVDPTGQGNVGGGGGGYGADGSGGYGPGGQGGGTGYGPGGSPGGAGYSQGGGAGYAPGGGAGYGPGGDAGYAPGGGAGYAPGGGAGYAPGGGAGYAPASGYGSADAGYSGGEANFAQGDPSGYGSGQFGGGVTGLGQALASGERPMRDPTEVSQTMKSSRNLRKSFGANTEEPPATARLKVNEPDWKAPLVSTADTSMVKLDGDDGIPHPWYRYFARGMDGYFAQLFATICAVPFAAPTMMTGNYLWLIMAIPLWIIMFLAYEPICLSKWGTTLGKLLWHIEVKHPDGTNLTMGEAFKRVMMVMWGSGQFWCLIPFGGIGAMICMILCMNRLNEQKITSWDREMSLVYLHKPIGPGRVAAITGAFVFGIVVQVAIQIAIAAAVAGAKAASGGST